MDRAARMRAAPDTGGSWAPDLREGLDGFCGAETGGLIVLGNDDVVEQISGGGFRMDVEFTSTGLRELAKWTGR